MQYFFTKKFDGTFTMSWIGLPASTDEVSTQLRDIKNFSITPTKSVKSITNFSDIVKGETENHYFKKYFSYSNTRSGISYIEQAPITGITGDYCPLDLLYLNLYYYRIDNDVLTIPTLSINSIVIEGTYDIEATDEIIEVPDEGYIFEPKDIYKIFKLSGFELYGVNTNNLIIRYRFTQDGGRTYTSWEPLTSENISTKKLNPVRFAQVQYHVSKIDNSITSKVFDIILLGDFQNINNYYLKTNRYGIREDCSLKYPQWSGDTSATGTNSTGSDYSICITGKNGTNGNGNGKIDYKGDGKVYNYNQNWFTQGLSCYLTGNIISSLTSQNSSISGSGTGTGNSTGGSGIGDTGLYDPYAATKKIGEWYNYLANSIGKILGWTVDYHLTDPDGKGIDTYLHEYQLFNIIDVQKIKIIVPENNFPDNQVVINEFALDMLDTFQIIILKDEFHRAFGIEKRPAQKDIIFFCQANRFYRVRHAQIHRDIMYLGIYYNVVLEKYEALANERNLSDASKSIIEPLTKNNTIDALFGEEMREDEEKIINKQFKPTTHEVYRLELNPKVTVIKKEIYNSLKGTKIADSYYNFSSVTAKLSAVTYSFKDSSLNVSDNRAFNIWFNFNNKYDPNKIIDEAVFNSYRINNTNYYELLNNHILGGDSEVCDYIPDDSKGYKIWYYNKQIILTINNISYPLNVTGLTTNIWYGLTINIDNRQRIISLDLYKRNYDYNITMFKTNYQNVTVNSTDLTGITYYTTRGYRPVKNTELNIQLKDTNLLKVTSIEYSNIEPFSFEIDKTLSICASDIKLTNLRIFDDVIPEESKSNILLQRIIQDSNYLMLADNASGKLYTENVTNTRWE